nr:PAS domain-containing protein [candidate division Zixibacteria bacterium]
MPSGKSKKSKALNELLYDQFFQQVPFNVAIIDRDYNIIEANNNFREYFGDWQGKKCFSVYKKQKTPCAVCSHHDIFKDGRTRVVDTVVADKNDRWVHHVIQSAPLRLDPDGPVDFIVEISSVVTDTGNWQQEYNVLFDRVPCYITVIDENYRIVRANESFRNSFGDVLGRYCYEVYKRRDKKCPRCPATRTFRDGKIHRLEQTGIGKRGQEIDYAVTTSPLVRGGERIAHVIEISNDITRIKKLEKEVLEAERLAAVGQTVAGLAHSIKNILMGLEGGKYMISLGLQKDDRSLIDRGSEMLDRNFDKTTSLVKDFLSFSKGRLPKLKMTDPNVLVREILDLYKDIAAKSGIELKGNLDPKIAPAPLDPDAIHTCLTNLVSNAIDACLMGDQKGSEVVIATRGEQGKLVIEVTDNGSGMDYEIKKKIFTTFFTTKGGGGTGLGLLTTRKLVQEHGGAIIVESEKGKGTRFRMEFPRKRLEMLYKES